MDSSIWFAKVEAIFETHRITREKTKFDYVIASLDNQYAMEIRDLLLNPPAKDPYTCLKTELIKRTQLSQHERLR